MGDEGPRRQAWPSCGKSCRSDNLKMEQKVQQNDQIVSVFSPAITNTLILAQLDSNCFQTQQLEDLKTKLNKYGQVTAFAALKSFGRILVVFAETMQSLRCRIALEKDEEFHGKVYFGDYVHLDGDYTVAGSKPGAQASFLQVPGNERNFLISPPGSPPIGWVQTEEAGPNPNPHADDIMQALRELANDPLELDAAELEDFALDQRTGSPDLQESEADTVVPSESSTPVGGPTIPFSLSIPLRAPEQDRLLDSPILIKVENWDVPDHHILTREETEQQEERNEEFHSRIRHDQQQWLEQRRHMHTQLPKTARPPV